MAYWHGFKTYAAGIAADVRSQLGLGLFAALDPHALATHLLIPVVPLSSFLPDAPEIAYLYNTEPNAFSAVTVFAGTRRTIVHNDAHSLGRQSSNLCHELSHGLLQHPPTPALDDSGCRIWNQDIEDEAKWLAGCLLMTEPAALAVAKGRWTIATAAQHFGISEAMVRYRVNKTGAASRTRPTPALPSK